MSHEPQYIDWQTYPVIDGPPAAHVVDGRRRMRLLSACCCFAFALVLARLVTLEMVYGSGYRAEAARPFERRQSISGLRGRILARDGTVLVEDVRAPALAVAYRYLEDPPDPRWLRNKARARLSRKDRRDPQRMAEAEAQVRRETDALNQRLAVLCGLSIDEWRSRAAVIQARVTRIAESANRRDIARRQQRAQPASAEPADSWTGWIAQQISSLQVPETEGLTRARIIVREELEEHVIVRDLPLEVITELEGRPDLYPGVRMTDEPRRKFRYGGLAAHLIGYLGSGDDAVDAPEDDAGGQPQRVGLVGIERQYDRVLHGSDGVAVVTSDASGRVTSSYRLREPIVGGDVVLTVDASLQRAAESLLDSALKRRLPGIEGETAPPAGGAIAVIDVHSGAVLAAASAPRFDPVLFEEPDSAKLAALLENPDKPFIDRTISMAIPPGSTFKPLTALALLDAGVDAQAIFTCRGYLDRPDRQRCQIYIREGIGHEEVSLAGALAQSCNVYFFHHARHLSPYQLADWARRAGFGRSTGIDLPGEATGHVPDPNSDGGTSSWQPADTMALAIGQSTLTVTPLQMVRFIAAVANGGQLVSPHVVSRLRTDEPLQESVGSTSSTSRFAPPQPIEELNIAWLDVVRRGMEMAVDDSSGTAYATVHIDELPIAGKTGTAETGGRDDHAWFAGYAPADAPRVAFVIALEHAGEGGAAAGPVARRLVQSMQKLGLLKQR